MSLTAKTALTGAILTALVAPCRAAAPSAESALSSLTPIQRGIDYETPAKDQFKNCTIKAETIGDNFGWVIRDANGQVLRRFVDTNGDKKVDRWCYYKEGVEVYRDIDADFDGKADQYRWLGTAGIRWGVDKNEDKTIDSWQAISAEEVSAEVVNAFRTRDQGRFERLLLTKDELRRLQLGDEQTRQLSQKISTAKTGFRTLANRQKRVGKDSQWIHFGGGRPGVYPAGTNGSKKDLFVYDNVSAVVESGGKHAHVVIGTMIRVGDVWRVVDLPSNLIDGQVASTPTGFFFAARTTNMPTVESGKQSGLSEAATKLIRELETIDKQLTPTASGRTQSKLNAQRADILEKLIAGAANDEERTNWIRQFADTVSAAVQSGGYPAGVGRLNKLVQQLDKNKSTRSHVPYVQFRQMTAAYGHSMQQPKADYAKIQEKWLTDLQAFVNKYPKDDDTADAMLQLAIAHEFAGDEKQAAKWFGQIVKDFPKSESSKKAAGAKTRLECVGRSISLRGIAASGRNFDLAEQRGKMVLIHYWATWCEPCKKDIERIKKLHAQYRRKGFAVVGVNLDTDSGKMKQFLASNRLPWEQLHETGGLDSRFANELGILTLPTMILLDKRGKVVNRNIHTAELEETLEKQLRR